MMNKRGQLAIFVIIAIVIIAVILVLLFPRIRIGIQPAPPEVELRNCLSENVQGLLNTSLENGGELNPRLYYLYNNITVGYVCYTTEWYVPCVMQKPLLKKHIEDEIEEAVKEEVRLCLDIMLDEFESRGYDVDVEGDNMIDVEIIPENVIISLNSEITFTKGEDSSKLTIPKADFKSQAYKLIAIASSIANWESRYGDAVPETYMGFYPDVKVEKKKQVEGSTVYILSHRDTNEVFNFASRSVAWPPGYAF